MSNQYKPFLLT